MGGDDKLSHIDQYESAARYVQLQRWTLVGSFEDLDVSAISTSPWERPDLAPWLTERAHEWDALVFTKTDRAFKSARDAANLAAWIEDQGKILAFSDDGIKLDHYHGSSGDMADMMSRMFLQMSSMFAEIEGKRFQSRAQARVRSLQHTDRWAFGAPPYGFRIIDHPSGHGKALGHDPETQHHLHHDIAQPLLNGESLTRITHSLNERGIPSPRDAVRIRKGESARGDQWQPVKVKHILCGPATQGIKVTQGRPVLDSHGEPVRVGPASFGRDTWGQIQAALAARTYNGHSPAHSINPLLGVAKCAECGYNMRQQSKTTAGRTYRYYVCGRKPRACPRVSITADTADSIVTERFLWLCGDLPVTEQRYQVGEDHSYDLADVNRTIEQLRDDRAAGLFPTDQDQTVFREQMSALIARREHLEAQPHTPAGWVSVETGETYRDAWPSADAESQRRMLRDAGVELRVSGPTDYEIHIQVDTLTGNYPSAISSRDVPGLPAEYDSVGEWWESHGGTVS